jgi:hypothetical protein
MFPGKQLHLSASNILEPHIGYPDAEMSFPALLLSQVKGVVSLFVENLNIGGSLLNGMLNQVPMDADHFILDAHAIRSAEDFQCPFGFHPDSGILKNTYGIPVNGIDLILTEKLQGRTYVLRGNQGDHL